MMRSLTFPITRDMIVDIRKVEPVRRSTDALYVAI